VRFVPCGHLLPVVRGITLRGTRSGCGAACFSPAETGGKAPEGRPRGGDAAGRFHAYVIAAGAFRLAP